MKCKTYKCKARCCYNVPFDGGELSLYKDRIVNPIIVITPVFNRNALLAWTSKDPMSNRCPFLRADLKCNIYEHRPAICRLMAEIPEMPCRHRKI